MMAAIAAAENGNTVTLIEQNEKLGKKLFLTGKGRCNLTNACPVEELFDNIVTNPKFLYSAFYDFDNNTTVGFFKDNGLRVKTERGNRVFPASDHSSDVIKALEKKIASLGITVFLKTKMTAIELSEDKIAGVIVRDSQKERKITADAVVLACGGKSYPLTGSDGGAIKLVQDLGIKAVSFEPALVPFECKDRSVCEMQGLSLKNVSLTLLKGKRKLYSGFGEMLFTHFGLSGPLVLSASSYVKEKDYTGDDLYVSLDLKPALSPDELDKRIQRDFADSQNKKFANSLDKLLPSKMITAVIEKSGINPGKKVNVVTRQERQQLCGLLKDFRIQITGNRGFNEAIISRGGVSVSQIDPSTMECKSIKGLYFAGEMIDTDALTGGFNLQIAWSTGHLAGSSIKEE